MRVSASIIAAALLVSSTSADVYMHNPRGSNGRNCEKNENRENANRLFDTQNNDAGGYACPRAETFSCYTYLNDQNGKNQCNAQNTQNPNKGLVSQQSPHNLNTNNQDYNPTERMYYVEGSVLPIEWTNQHACGTNDKVHCDVVIQIACEDTLSDDCGTGRTGNAACGPRDGTPVNNNQGDQVNGRATARIPDNTDQQDDYRYGRHETYRYYEQCKRRERNKGLWTADQNVNGNSAEYTRQNPNGQRYGLECPEESEYFPYWHPTPFRDIGVVVSDLERCKLYETESQNVKAKGFCNCNEATCGAGKGNLPNNPAACANKGGVWEEQAAWGIAPPRCEVGAFSRDNHLGNVGADGQPYHFNWTIPKWAAGKESCTLRIRYNISTGDVNDTSVYGDSTLNDDRSPIIDRNNREELSYRGVLDYKLGLAVNSNQYGRTFQDRSYMFSVKERNEETAGDCENSGTIYNLNVRGKRGNIVQVYPNVEYDFVPNTLVVTQDDCVHVQWTGSDYNPNRNPNNAEGGPPDAANDGQARADRHNIVQMDHANDNAPEFDASKYTMFEAPKEDWVRLAYLDQKINTPECETIQQLKQRSNNRQQRERYHTNCMKLSGARTPYHNMGMMKPGAKGSYQYMSTRNNNFSNRGQKAHLIVESGRGVGGTIGVVIGVLAGIGVAGAAAVTGYRKFGGGKAAHGYAGSAADATQIVVGSGAPASGKGKVLAIYDHEAKEPGELSFRKGEYITVTNRDKSGWWTGRTDSGAVGIFPANYIKE
jgi:hypothetical protein